MSHKDFELFPNELSSWNLWRYLFKLSCLKTKAVGIMASQHVKKLSLRNRRWKTTQKLTVTLIQGKRLFRLILCKPRVASIFWTSPDRHHLEACGKNTGYAPRLCNYT